MSDNSTVTQIAIIGELNIFKAAELRQSLLDVLGASTDVEVNLSQVSEIDSAGIQLMIGAMREASDQDKLLRFTGHSPAVIDILELYGLVGHFCDAVPIAQCP